MDPQMHSLTSLRWACFVALLLLVPPSTGIAQSGLRPTVQADSAQAAVGEDPLAEEQRAAAERFRRLEDLLLRSSELEALENPARAALLQQAVKLAKESQLADSMAEAARRLESNQLSEAIQQQKTSRANLERLLTLLQSENREERVREQRDKVRGWIEETERLLRLQGSLRGRTEGGQDLEQAAGDQDKLTDKADNIASDIRGDSPEAGSKQENTESKQGSSQESKAEDSKNEGSDSKDNGAEQTGESQLGEEESKEQNSADGKQAQDSSKEGDAEQNEQAPSDAQKSESKESESQQSDSQQSDSQSGQSGRGSEASEPQDPTERAQQRIERARARMKEAEQALREAKREDAVEKQREAEEELRQAIDDLESILRQLREEEIERSLASLESRLRRMLDMQNKVLEETKRLQEIGGEEGSRRIEIKASALSKDEMKILAEGERALLLLRDEGSSAAFPEAVEQVNTDAAKVAERLSKGDVGTLTTVIEEEIVNSLEEMVAALVQVQKDQKEKKQQQQSGQGQQGQQGDQPLIDKLAEIRLVKTLQLRVNGRTQTLSKMLSDPDDPVGQAEQGEILSELQSLAERQSSIQRVTAEISRSE